MADETKAELIVRERWPAFLAEFTTENRGAHARLEILNLEDVGRIVETENRLFQGISADTKDGEQAIWITLGGDTAAHLTHGIQRVKTIWMRPAIGQSGNALEIIAEDGSKTVLELSTAGAFSLPAAAR